MVHGISVLDSEICLEGDSSFKDNVAMDGGGLYLKRSQLNCSGYILFVNNHADGNGGGLLLSSSKGNLEGTSSFISNAAYHAGGALYSEYSTVSVEGDGRFINNSGEFGGGISIAYGGGLMFNGNNTFAGNWAYQGGGFNVQNSHLSNRGNIDFRSNLAGDVGGGILSLKSNLKLEGGCSFVSNTAYYGGGALYSDYSTVSVEGDGRFINNSAEHGGGISIANGGEVTLNGNYTFAENLAQEGGGINVCNSSLSSRGHISFTNNLANISGGGFVSFNSSVNLEGGSSFVSNTASYDGGALYSVYSIVSVEGDGRFINNSAEYGGGIAMVYGGGLTLNGSNTFADNWAYQGGGINVQNSWLTSRGNISFTNNLATSGGGGLMSVNCSVKFEGSSSFTNNLATSGGGLVSFDSSVKFEGSNNFVTNTAYYAGGAIYSYHSTVCVEGDGRFINNSADLGGGIVNEGNLTLNGDITFVENWAYQGGGINVQNSSLSSSGHISFINNVANYSGGAISSNNTNVRINGVGRFMNNSAKDGGGFSILDGSEVTLSGNNTFSGNMAKRSGGGINVQNSWLISRGNVIFSNNLEGGLVSINGLVQLERSNKSSTPFEVGDRMHNGHVTFVNNFATWGGGFWISDRTNMSVTVVSEFTRNTAEYGGGGVGIYSGSTVTFSGMSIFTQNTARYGGGAHLVDSTMRFMARTDVHNNSAVHGGGIHGSRAILEVCETVSFTENSATNGGGLSLASGSQCLLSSNTTVYLRGNHAEQNGGAIFVADEPFSYCTFSQNSFVIDSREHCFFQPLDLPDSTARFILENNTAADAGTELYGGMVDRCDIQNSRTYYRDDFFFSGVIFNTTFNITKDKNAGKESVISSEPFQVCPCYDGHPNCSQSDVTVTVYPGETFPVSLVAVGQRNGTAPSIIRSSFDDTRTSLGDLQHAQSANNTCTPLHYTVSSTNNTVTMTLLADGPCLDLGEPLYVNIHLKPCPTGFQLSEASKECVCEHRLQKYTNSCDIDDLVEGIDGNAWVGLDKSADGTILHPYCPFDYCKSYSVRFRLNNTDLQCNYNRRGLLCGGCQPGLTLALGSSHCLKCSNAYLSLLVVFALAGIALVVLLLICKLTVAVGTINGLIFYANIIAVNQSVLFPSENTNLVMDILRVFIAWLNLDLGIKTCFYDGMNAYARTWLQFIFPVYIWVLVCSIIILCYYKTWAVRMFGRNPVAVLATLFLLSYAKLLRTIITALSFTFLEYPDGSEVAVWLYDGNVRYLQGKHIPLFLVAMMVLLLVFLPYTFVLLFGQWMQAHSKMRLFSWINDHRVMAFLDAYHGPVRKEHRYWSGLLLVFRTCLFLVFAFNALGNPNVNLLAIIICTAVLTLLTVFTGRIYVNWYLQGLEASFIMNSLVFAAATLYRRSTNENQAALTYTSVGIALVTFAGIIIYHVTIQLKDSRVWKDIIHPMLQRHQRQWVAVPLDDPVEDVETDITPPHAPTGSFINLRETLLEDSVPDVEDERRVPETERYIVQHCLQPTQTVVDLHQLIHEDPANNILPMIELH